LAARHGGGCGRSAPDVVTLPADADLARARELALRAEAAAARTVERRHGLAIEEFRRDYLLPRRPVVLTDAAAAWPAYGVATPDWFRAHHGSLRVRLLGRECTLAELLDRIEQSGPDKPAPYPCKFEIARELRALLPAVSPRFAYSLPDRQADPLVPQRLFDGVNNLEVFFGGPGGRFPYLHYDVMRLHAWITQLHGDKQFTLYAPDQAPFLYPDPQQPWQSSIRNHHEPDFERYPLLRCARAQTIVLRAGETLFLPCGWWHTARSLGVTISIAFDQLGADNWRDFSADAVDVRRRAGKRAKGLLLGAYLRAIEPALALGDLSGVHSRRDWGAR
jgi:hypothetical protein